MEVQVEVPVIHGIEIPDKLAYNQISNIVFIARELSNPFYNGKRGRKLLLNTYGTKVIYIEHDRRDHIMSVLDESFRHFVYDECGEYSRRGTGRDAQPFEYQVMDAAKEKIEGCKCDWCGNTGPPLPLITTSATKVIRTTIPAVSGITFPDRALTHDEWYDSHKFAVLYHEDPADTHTSRYETELGRRIINTIDGFPVIIINHCSVKPRANITFFTESLKHIEVGFFEGLDDYGHWREGGEWVWGHGADWETTYGMQSWNLAEPIYKIILPPEIVPGLMDRLKPIALEKIEGCRCVNCKDED